MQQIYLIDSLVMGCGRDMIHRYDIAYHPYRVTIEYRIKTITFFDRYGPAATREAFDASRVAVYL